MGLKPTEAQIADSLMFADLPGNQNSHEGVLAAAYRASQARVKELKHLADYYLLDECNWRVDSDDLFRDWVKVTKECDSLRQKLARAVEALEEADGAIQLAVMDDDGLDGGVGIQVLEKIAKSLTELKGGEENGNG